MLIWCVPICSTDMVADYGNMYLSTISSPITYTTDTGLHVQAYMYRPTVHVQAYWYRPTCTGLHIQAYMYRPIYIQTYMLWETTSLGGQICGAKVTPSNRRYW